MRAARGSSTPSKPQPSSSSVMPSPPPQETKESVQLLPRIAEYKSKGWITAEEESDYQQLLSSQTTTNHLALQVEKALDLAKAKHEHAANAAPTNSRSLFRKAPTTNNGVTGEMTLQKKLSHRRKSRMGMTSPTPAGSNEQQEPKEKQKVIMEPTELSIMEAMFGKKSDVKQENETAVETPNKRDDRLARARHRRARSSFSPDAVKKQVTKPAVEQRDPTDTTRESKDAVDLTRRKSNERSSTLAAQKLLSKRLQKTSSQRSLYSSSSSRSKREGSIGESPTISLSESSSTDQQENLHAGRRSLFQQQKQGVSTNKQEQVLTESFIVSETTQNSVSNSREQEVAPVDPQEPVTSGGSRSIFQQKATKTAHPKVVTNPPIRLQERKATSTEQQTTSMDKQEPKKAAHPKVVTNPPIRLQDNVSSNDEDLQICEPRDLWQRKRIQSEEAVKDLFVEMAFFARLGFVQPPSCLHCTYRESIEKTSPELLCKRYVPWRKNANIPIHPHKLDDNIILVQCHTARALVQGETDHRYRWDIIKRELIWQQTEN